MARWNSNSTCATRRCLPSNRSRRANRESTWSTCCRITSSSCCWNLFPIPAACITRTWRNSMGDLVIKKKALFRGRDYITTQEWTDAEIEVLLDVSSDLKRKFKRGVPHRYLADQTIFLMFFDKSTRTRNSFEAGVAQLGGPPRFLPAAVVQVARGE